MDQMRKELMNWYITDQVTTKGRASVQPPTVNEPVVETVPKAAELSESSQSPQLHSDKHNRPSEEAPEELKEPLASPELKSSKMKHSPTEKLYEKIAVLDSSEEDEGNKDETAEVCNYGISPMLPHKDLPPQ